MAISQSNLPALRNAGSSESGRFVAPITITGLPSFLSQARSKESTARSVQLYSRGMDTSKTGLTVHAGEQLGDDPPLHLSLRRLPLGRDGVNLVDEE